MGTLTADVPRLAEHCSHKLPTSCRLTATPLCCACYDRRPHSNTYSVYVDGVGFVQRGTRWQNYCWFCKTFWGNRVTAVGIPSADTRIPEHPDQAEFLERWFEFYQGYRIVKLDNGREQRVAVCGEPLREVAPGHLPRTTDDLRRGATTSSVERLLHNRTWRTVATQIEISQPVQSLDETLDDLLHEAIAEEQGSRAEERAAEEEDVQRPAVQRPENLPPETQASGRRPSRTSRPQGSTTTIDVQARLRERFARIYGTPEEISSEEYVSPIAGMFNRAWDRHRRFQELRRAQEGLEEGRSAWPIPEAGSFPSRQWGEEETLVQAGSLEMYNQLSIEDGLQEFRRTLDRPNTFTESFNSTVATDGSSAVQAQDGPTASNQGEDGQLRDILQEIQAMTASHERIDRRAAEVLDAHLSSILHRRRTNVPEFIGLDGDDRPAPLEDEQMTVKLDCKICLSQIADTACLPCGHLSMCVWCADQAIPVSQNDKTRPQSRNARCPVCRKGVKQRVKIYPH